MSNKIIRKGLAFRCEQSGSVARLDEAAWPRSGDPAPPACSPARGFGSDGAIRRPKPKEDSVKLTDAQLVLLSRAIQRDDGALEIPDDLKNSSKKTVDKLLGAKMPLAVTIALAPHRAHSDRGRDSAMSSSPSIIAWMNSRTR